jgi:hypothetical protein
MIAAHLTVTAQLHYAAEIRELSGLSKPADLSTVPMLTPGRDRHAKTVFLPKPFRAFQHRQNFSAGTPMLDVAAP